MFERKLSGKSHLRVRCILCGHPALGYKLSRVEREGHWPVEGWAVWMGQPARKGPLGLVRGRGRSKGRIVWVRADQEECDKLRFVWVKWLRSVLHDLLQGPGMDSMRYDGGEGAENAGHRVGGMERESSWGHGSTWERDGGDSAFVSARTVARSGRVELEGMR